MTKNELCEIKQASLSNAIIVEQDIWQAVCINCYDLVVKGVTECSTSLNFVIETALKLAKQLNLPAVIWSTNCKTEQKLAHIIAAQNNQIKTPEQILNA